MPPISTPNSWKKLVFLHVYLVSAVMIGLNIPGLVELYLQPIIIWGVLCLSILILPAVEAVAGTTFSRRVRANAALGCLLVCLVLAFMDQLRAALRYML